ncbi:hypothetical protein ILUMI_23542 [Ignelater luminosus]|uniref:Transposase n=1 Tax=Ignelater luminosus TaxID=2038154 RepID=A0A8K0G1T3_IGNLU|nr:hypothetical protein ILUMI_23542 [Ignelater luminosus]
MEKPGLFGIRYKQIKGTVYRLKKAWTEEQRVSRKQGGGRPKISSENKDNLFINYLRENPLDSAVTASRTTNFPEYIRSARNRIKESDISFYSSARKISLTDEQKLRRTEVAQQVLHENWNNVIFSDEKVFQSNHNGTVHVYRPRNTRFNENYITENNRSGRFSVIVWAWTSARGPGVCWRMDERLDEATCRNIIDNVMLLSENFIYQHPQSTLICQPPSSSTPPNIRSPGSPSPSSQRQPSSRNTQETLTLPTPALLPC